MAELAQEPSRRDTAGRSSSVYLEREGERRIQRLLAAVDNVPWTVSLLQLAWTAGPVTFLAAQGGYYFGYGEFLPPDRVAFFVGYTVLAGIIGLATKVVYDSFRGERQRRRQDALTTALDRLPELIHAVRDLSLVALTPEVRRREAAWLLLQKAELEPEGIASAVEDMTGSTRLAQAAQRVELYRRMGLNNRARDLLEADAAQLSLVLDELYANAPAMAATLRERLEGRGPTHKKGVPREENFLERVLAASEEENEALMTLRDVEECLVLAFELISGREIPVLMFSYRGQWRLERATDAVEQARGHYRIAQATGYSRLKALVAYLVESRPELDELVAGQPTTALLQIVDDALDHLTDEIYRLRVEVVSGRASALEPLHEQTLVLGTAIELYRAIQRAYRELGRRHGALVRARQKWESVSARYRESATRLRTGRGHGGLRISRRTIRLLDEQKLEVAEALVRPLRSLDLRRRPRMAAGEPEEESSIRPLTVESAKRLAIDIALVLENYIHITRPEIQRAINSSNAAHLGGLVPGLSAASKAAYGEAAVREVRTSLARTAEHLASALVRHYRIELTDAAIAFLHRNYGASTETLRVLADYSEQTPTVRFPPHRHRPPPVPPANETWTRQYDRAVRLLARHGISVEEEEGED